MTLLPLILAQRPLDIVGPQLLQAVKLQGLDGSNNPTNRAVRLDANNLIPQINSKIERVLSKIIEDPLPDLVALTLPQNPDRSPGVEAVTWQEVTGGGEFPVYQGGELRQVVAASGAKSIFSAPHAAAFGWKHQELLRVALFDDDLSTRKGMLTRRAYAERVERVVLLGDNQYNLTGFINNPDIPRAAIVRDPRLTTNGAVTDATAVALDGSDGSTATQIRDAMLRFCDGVAIDTNETVQPKGSLLIPPKAWRHCNETPMDSTNRISIREEFERISGIKLLKSIRLTNVAVADSGLNAVKNFIVLCSMDAMEGEVIIPSPQQFYAVQQVGLEYLVPTYAEIAGFAPYVPKAHRVGYY